MATITYIKNPDGSVVKRTEEDVAVDRLTELRAERDRIQAAITDKTGKLQKTLAAIDAEIAGITVAKLASKITP